MDRQIVWPGAIPLETDILNTERNALAAIGALASALFGTSTIANGLAVVPTAPASMAVKVATGEIYAVANVDDTAYSSLAADTAHQTVKQGINAAAVTLACAAPTTAGYSVNYLIEAAFAESDTDSTVLPYYNSSDPTQAYSGPGNTGSAQPTRRKGSVTVTAKPGVAAATGSQTTPAADAGYIGLCVVTVPYGAASITADMISPISSAPVVPVGGILAAIKAIAYASRAETAAGTSTAKGVTPDGLSQAVQGGSFLYGVAGGSATALTLTLVPAPAALVAGMQVILKATATNTGGATLNLSGLGSKPIKAGGVDPKAGLILSGQLYALIYDGAVWQLQSPTQGGIVSFSYGTASSYEIYSTGKVEQWGKAAFPSGTGTVAVTVTFPIPFPTAATFASGSTDNSASSSWGWLGIECQSLTQTNMNLVADAAAPTQAISSGRNGYWMARGY